MRAVAEHHVEQHRRDVGAERLLPQDLPAGGRVDHRMRPSLGVLLLAEVQADVRPGRRGQAQVRVQRDVRVHRAERLAEDHLSLVAQRAAGEEAAHRGPAGPDPAPGLPLRSGASRPRISATRSAPASSVAASEAPASPPSGADMPRQAATTGVPRLAPITVRATSRSGGLEISRMTSVPGSASSARTASRAISPPTSADRSRPPTPMTWDTPMPQRSSSVMTSCAPVPAAATTPTGPAPTALAKPSPTPPSMAVPAPGPITSRPSPLARCLSATSSATGTLSLNSRTCRPAVSAEWAAIAAYGPGTDTTATLAAGSSRAASPTVRGSGWS